MASKKNAALEKGINGVLPTIEPSQLPSHFTEDKERFWAKHWNEMGIYQYDSTSEKEVFSIDTPPPTASGTLHIGHIFSYSHTDMIARYQRMSGKNIFYPMGWDDNGLPTERRVQNYYHVWCSETAPYEPNLHLPVPSEKDKKKNPRRLVSRKNFVELCAHVTKMDEIQFKELFTRVGLSVDWREEYATISKHSRRIAQLSFLDMYQKGHVYQSSNPTLWDIDFQTAIAQAEVEDRDTPGAFHKIHFGILDHPEQHFTIATTRPELLPACVAVAAHPNDARYQHLIGKMALTPLFHAPIPIFASEQVEMEKGTGILMICTFGDVMDVEWWKQQKFPLRQTVGRNGRLIDISFEDWNNLKEKTKLEDDKFYSINPKIANEAYASIKGKSLTESRKMIVEMLQKVESSAVYGNPSIPLAEPPKPLTHPVKYFEKGTRPLELIPTRQWFLRLLDKKEQLLEQGSKIAWKPDYMVKKYNDWVSGLNSDWCISRQRFFGVPFPIFYPIDQNGNIIFDKPILPKPEQLPIDPMFDVPEGYSESDRGQPNGFAAELDVFDTWWTSSLTPQIVTNWMKDGDSKHATLYPMSLRPQSHEIIRTWAFYTICKSLLHENSIPWKEVAISGWIVDKDGSKVSKSKGNATVTPMELLDKHFADGVRYWTGSARLGSDTILEEAQMAVGRRLVTKMYNAGKLAFTNYASISPDSEITCELDLALLAQLQDLSIQCDQFFKEHNFGKVMREAEIFFWSRFTDNYLEMVKNRAKDDSNIKDRDSAIMTMRFTMNIILRLFAPLLPHITEEIWSWALAQSTGIPSIHISPYPTKSDFSHIAGLSNEEHNAILRNRMDTAIACTETLRKLKTDNNLKFSAEIPNLLIKLNSKSKLELENMWPDILFAVKAKNLTLELDENLADKTFSASIL